jgi:hypothetical protein
MARALLFENIRFRLLVGDGAALNGQVLTCAEPLADLVRNFVDTP